MSSSVSSQNLRICVSLELACFGPYASILISYSLFSHFSSTIWKTFKYLPIVSREDKAKTSYLYLALLFFLSHFFCNIQLSFGCDFYFCLEHKCWIEFGRVWKNKANKMPKWLSTSVQHLHLPTFILKSTLSFGWTRKYM